MRIILTNHAEKKFNILKRFGWLITKKQVSKTIKSPTWKGRSRFGQMTAMSLVDKDHILRVIFNQESDIIKVITFHIARRGKYESKL